jgi:hypothetical protein
MIDDWFQNRTIRQARDVAGEAAIESRNTRSDVTQLERRVEALELDNQRLKLLAAALTQILREQSGITTESIEAKIAEVDARDGVLDGKLGAPRIDCTRCGRPVRTDRQFCLYCEAPVPTTSLF